MKVRRVGEILTAAPPFRSGFSNFSTDHAGFLYLNALICPLQEFRNSCLNSKFFFSLEM